MEKKAKSAFVKNKEDFMGKVSVLLMGDTRLSFSVDENLVRLEHQSHGDIAFYFLAILSFVEGFIREKYKSEEPAFDFDSPSEMSFLDMVKHVKKRIKPTKAQEKNLDFLFNFMRTHSDLMGYRDKDTREFIVTKSATKFYLDGDRIRHCYAPQTKENTRLLIQTFVQFAKNLNFYTENAEILNGLLQDDNYFSELKNRQAEKESDDLAEIGFQLIELINKGTSEEKEQAKELFDENQLQKSLYAKSWRDYQRMMSSLTEEQQAISDDILAYIKKDKRITKLIKGGPGTGKTLILINLLQQSLDKNILLLTYTNSLTKYNRYLANLVSFNKHIVSNSAKEKMSSKIRCFDEYFKELASKELKKNIVSLKDIDLSEINDICSKYEIYKEDLVYAANEIWLNLPGKSKYIDLTYAQSRPVSKEKQKVREQYWKAVVELEKLFDSKTPADYPLELFFFKLQDASISIPEKTQPEYLFIDEIQDLEAAKIESIRRICKKGFILTGDLTQSVFVRKGLPWGWLNKKNIPVPEQQLTKNFRSTEPIQALSNKYRDVIDLKDTDKATISKGFMPGPVPEAYVSTSAQTVFDEVQKKINFLKEQLYFDNKDFCIIAPNNDVLDVFKNKLKNTVSLEDDAFDFNSEDDLIRLSRLKYVKGIDLPVIMLILDKSFLDKEANDNLDIYGQENSIYTCISRAMNIINIFFIDDGEILKEPEKGEKKNSIYKLFNVMRDSVISLDNKS